MFKLNSFLFKKVKIVKKRQNKKKKMSECCNKGPGYKSPLMAMNAPKEQLLYTVMISCSTRDVPDCLATIDG